MKYLTNLALFLFLVNSTALAQLSVSVNGNNSMQVFTINDENVDLSQSSYLNASSVLTSDINTVTGLSTLLKSDAVEIFAAANEPLFTSQISTAGGDESLKIYAALNGSFIIRENIANFLFYDSKGEIKQTISNSSQSTEGESISEFAADPAMKTKVLYNPKIVRDGEEDSRARIIESDYTTNDFFYSSDRAIRSVKVTSDGQFIGVISYGSGDDQLSLFDRFGNELNTISFDQAVMDFEISSNGRFVALRSNGRVGVYDILSGERVGSTSFRSRLQFATYVPEDHTIVAITAERSGNTLSDIEFHAINTELRSIERKEYNGRLGFHDKVPVTLQRNNANEYVLNGFNNPVELSINF